MRITRAAKVAAFPLIVLALVALIACQGPAGVKGAAGTAGTAGTDGTDGTDGTAGTDGVNALSPAPTAGPRKIIDLDATTTSAIDLSDGYFTGGREPIDYEVTGTEPMEIPPGAGITLEEISGSMLPLKVTAIEAEATDGFDPIVVTISATDADNRFAENTVTIKRNAAPTFATNDDIDDIVVGVQEGDRDGVDGCAKLNVCIEDGFADADDGDELTYTINTDVVSVSANDATAEDVGDFKITGLTATTKAVMVKVTAMDENGLTVDSNEFSLTVNAEPIVKRAIASVNLPSRGTDAEKMVSFIIDSHFEDSDDLSFALVTDEKKAHNGEVATVAVGPADGTTGNWPVTVTAQGAGQTMVYLRATEDTGGDDTGIGQSVEASFMVTVD